MILLTWTEDAEGNLIGVLTSSGSALRAAIDEQYRLLWGHRPLYEEYMAKRDRYLAVAKRTFARETSSRAV